MAIDKDTIGLTSSGEPLSEIRITKVGVASVPPTPTGVHVFGLVYDLKPDRATFEPSATLEYTYDPSKIPEGVAENELVLAWWDAGVGKWVELESTVDPETNTITAPVSHFTAFATMVYGSPEPAPEPVTFSLSSLITSPNEVALGESVAISVEVTNIGGETGNYKVTLKIDGVMEASREILVNAGASQKITFTTSKDLPGTYAVDINGLSGIFVVMGEASSPLAPLAPPPAPAEPGNWPVLRGVTAGVFVIGLIIFLLSFYLSRRKAY